MSQQRQQQRLSALINQFKFKYQLLQPNCDSAAGALVQLWIPKRTSGGTCLTTYGAPFAFLGWASDALAEYRNYVSQYQPLCDSISNKTRCPISRVFANLPPDAAGAENTTSSTGDSNSSTEVERCAAARLAGIHSTLLLAVHEAEDPAHVKPVAVFELAQHEVDVDFSSAVSTLADVAQECGFWIPVYNSTHPRNSIDIPLLSRSGSEYNTASSVATRGLGVCSRSWLIVDTPPGPGSMGEQPQQQHSKRHRKPSVIYEEHLQYDQPHPVTAAYLATTGDMSTVGNRFNHPLQLWNSGSLPQLHMPIQPLISQASLPKSAQLFGGFWHEADAAPVQQNRHNSMPPQMPGGVQQQDELYAGVCEEVGLGTLLQQRHKSMPPHLQHVHWGEPPQQQQQPQPSARQRLQWDALQQLQQQFHQQNHWEDSSTRLPVVPQQQDSRGASMPLPMVTRPSSHASSSNSDRVRAIVTVGGQFRQTRTAGGWDYVGGVQKVVSLPRSANHRKFMDLLSSKAVPNGGNLGLGQAHVKYALPGVVGSFIELASDDDVLNMYEELDEYNASTAGSPMRLHLYIGTLAVSGCGTSSGGSDSSSRLIRSLHSPGSALMQLQPSTPTMEPSESASGLAYAAAQLSLLTQRSSSGTATMTTGMGSGGTATSGHHTPAAAAAVEQAADTQAMLAAGYMAQGRAESEPNLAKVQQAPPTAESQLGAEPNTGSFSIGGRFGGSSSVNLKQQLEQQEQGETKSEQEQQHKLRRRSVSLPQPWRRDLHMQQLLNQLKVQVEVITPSELHVVRFIGGGAFGEVYLAKWHGTEVAVKCLSSALLTPSSSSSSSSKSTSSSTAHKEAAAELMQEASTLAQMRHPNIVSVFGVVLPTRYTGNRAADDDFDQHADAGAAGSGSAASSLSAGHCSPVTGPAVVFEYMSAGSLQSAIRSGTDWLKSSMAKAKVMLDTARGLSYLHNKSMVHFDLKSANLLFTIKDRTPTVKVADFGLSKQRHQTYVTGVDSLRGTLPWIAPEIIKNPANVTEAADIYSYGVIMWELWTGKEPFEGVHLHALLHQLTTQGSLSLPVPGSPEWGEELVPAEPTPGWRELMLRCWSAEPAARPTSKQLIIELENIMLALRKSKK